MLKKPEDTSKWPKFGKEVPEAANPLQGGVLDNVFGGPAPRFPQQTPGYDAHREGHRERDHGNGEQRDIHASVSSARTSQSARPHEQPTASSTITATGVSWRLAGENHHCRTVDAASSSRLDPSLRSKRTLSTKPSAVTTISSRTSPSSPARRGVPDPCSPAQPRAVVEVPEVQDSCRVRENPNTRLL